MRVVDAYTRFTLSVRRAGVRASLWRITEIIHRTLIRNRLAIFHCDLTILRTPEPLPLSVTIERKRSESELSQNEMNEYFSYWTPTLAKRQMRERFPRGASLWLLKVDGKVAAYGWTLRGDTIQPHFLPLGQDDVHLFNFFTSPSFRGRGFAWLLTSRMTHDVAAEGAKRAYSEVAEWNRSSMAVFCKSSFRLLGIARKLTIGQSTFVCWHAMNPESSREYAKAHSISGLPQLPV